MSGCVGSSLLLRLFSSCSKRELLSCGFSLLGPLLLWCISCWGVGFSSCGMWAQYLHLGALGHRLNNYGARVQFCSKWDLPRPGIEPSSPAMASRFFATEPPGKPWTSHFKLWISGLLSPANLSLGTLPYLSHFFWPLGQSYFRIS